MHPGGKRAKIIGGDTFSLEGIDFLLECAHTKSLIRTYSTRLIRLLVLFCSMMPNSCEKLSKHRKN